MGSGTKWKNHINKHGKEYVVTDWVKAFDNQEECTEYALAFSRHHDIVDSKEYANLCEEDGIHAGTPGISQESRTKMSAAARNRSPETRAKLGAAHKGKTISEEHKAKLVAAHKNKIVSHETRIKLSTFNKGKTLSEEHKAKMSAAAKARYAQIRLAKALLSQP